ncbi:MBL fold metallo-hydrolase [Persicimonas caeni]|uniref:MBL fold metallo-hydrolase n=1 Tax=Persicimonas caeni TaxID=2292766 RepID=A0A4Y6PYG7_PERCE|nr:MBL fold metallo-hydrolase [Persicimonas caeni]QDG53374.1 MBL fold metallo-hydrolase [Persicimonas caeni]QED34595.1 MBL fold metallo-hydrolase [Persicimonas caeni]
MQLTSFGAAEGVTGSCHLLEVGQTRILLDCGIFQGGKRVREHNRPPLPIDPKSIDYIVVSHGHLDHIGRIPLFVKEGFDGEIISTRPTYEISRISLVDSVELIEQATKRANANRPEGTPPIAPLYEEPDIFDTFDRWNTFVGYHEPLELTENIRLTFYDAGHILGSAFILLELTEGDETRRLLFSGDLGNVDKPLIRDPERAPEADIAIVESTYGDRSHRAFDETVAEFEEAICTTIERNGNVLVPTFAVERAQELLYVLYEAWRGGRLPKNTRIYLDSPMAIDVTRVFTRFPEFFDKEALEMAENGGNPFNFAALTFSRSARDSIRINDHRSGAIILAGSGMVTGGRILHHLRFNLERPECSVVFCGYQAEGSLGRQIVEGASTVRIMGSYYDCNAQVWTINGFSAHAGRRTLTRWVNQSAAKRVLLVHGEEDAKAAFQGHLEADTEADAVHIMRFGEPVTL